MQARRMFSIVSNPVREQYERWPYPRIPLFARVHREQLWQLNLSWLASRCGVNAPTNRARIWIAGCGTFQPYVFGRANPGAEILASDLSQRSLQIAKNRCRLHRVRKVDFQQIDLNEANQYPTGPFDFIECYGVLMSLRDPQEVLRRFATSLAAGGILRLMVYPLYSRQRIFQIQRLARLLGLRFDNPSHPKLLRELMASLPSTHPLHYSFFNYHDSQNLEGIVDGFLHASDRGFSGIELCEMADRAGLAPVFYFHRPWGQPRVMAEKLGYGGQHPAFWLHYLDLWQELRTNFVVCFVRKDSIGKSRSETQKLDKHPLFDFGNRQLGIRHRSRLLRLSLTGVSLSSRTHESSLRLSGKGVRALTKGRPLGVAEAMLKEILPNATSPEENADVEIPSFLASIRANSPFLVPRLGARVPNPLYSHLFDAYLFAQQWNQALKHKLPGLENQIERWRPLVDPLENQERPFGFTPFGSYLSCSREIPELGEAVLSSQVSDFADVQIEEEKEKIQQVQNWLGRFSEFSKLDMSPAQLRELWILLFSHSHFSLRFQPV